MLVPQPNSSVTSLTSGRELDVTRTTPLTTPTPFSTGREIRLSTSMGAAPSYAVLHRQRRIGDVRQQVGGQLAQRDEAEDHAGQQRR